MHEPFAVRSTIFFVTEPVNTLLNNKTMKLEEIEGIWLLVNCLEELFQSTSCFSVYVTLFNHFTPTNLNFPLPRDSES